MLENMAVPTVTAADDGFRGRESFEGLIASAGYRAPVFLPPGALRAETRPETLDEVAVDFLHTPFHAAELLKPIHAAPDNPLEIEVPFRKGT